MSTPLLTPTSKNGNDCDNNQNNDEIALNTSFNENNNNVNNDISFSSLNLHDISFSSSNLNENNENSHNKNVPKLHVVQSATEYIKNNYENTKSLSTSLLGQILIGTHIESGHVHCIKMCLKEMQKTLSDRIAENSHVEIEAMEAICTQNHPYLIQLLDAVEDEDLYVIILDYVPNGDMCSHLEKTGCGLPRAQAQKYYKQLVEAVAFIHSKGYCHLDISLENILIDKSNDCIKLCDFGLSRSFLPHNKPFPASHIRPGKIGYIAPEIVSYQSFNGDKVDSFSLGVILFMFLTGFPPFRMASSKDACFQCIFSGGIDRLLREWKMLGIIPLEAKDLLSKIFTRSENRISVNDILNHPWLQIDGNP